MDMEDMRNYYEDLGVHPTASPSEIHDAYRRLVTLYHPDKHEQNELRELALEKLKVVNEAYGILSSPHQREAYDERFFTTLPTDQEPEASSLDSKDQQTPFQRAFFWIAAIACTTIVTRILRHVVASLFVIGLFGLWYVIRKNKRS